MKYLMSAKLGMLLGELIVWITSLLLIAVAASAADPPRTLVPCEVLSVHDGDTIQVNVLMPWDITIRKQTVRMQGYDAWEITRSRHASGIVITDAELVKGKAARDALDKLLAGADVVYLEPQRPGDVPDPHGRFAAYVHIWAKSELTDVAKYMRAHGHQRK